MVDDESSVESSLWLSLSLSLTGSASAANLQSMPPDTGQYGFYLCESRCDSVINIILGPNCHDFAIAAAAAHGS